MLAVSVPSGSSVYPDLPSGILDLLGGSKVMGNSNYREIPAGTTWIDVTIINPNIGYKNSFRISNPTSETRYFDLPVGNGYRVEVIAGASGIRDVDVSLVAALSNEFNVIQGYHVIADMELRRASFTLTTAPTATLLRNQPLSMTGNLKLPISINTANIDLLAAVFTNSDESKEMDLICSTPGTFENDVAQAVTFSGTTPNELTEDTTFECRYIVLDYSSPYSLKNYVLVLDARSAPIASTLVQYSPTALLELRIR